MAVIGRLRHRLLLLVRSERDMALPTALFAMIASFGLASAAVLSSVDAQQGTSRDRESKSAIAAADAGSNLALLRLNRFQGSLTIAHPCVGPGGEEQAETPTGSGWCPATSTESVGGSTFSYAVSAFQGKESELNVVSVGTAGGVSRRVEVGLVSYSGENVFANEKMIGQNGIVLEGNAKIETDIGTNGSIEQKGKGSTEICGEVRVGVGQSDQGGACKEGSYEVTEGEKNLPAIVLPEDLTTKNDDCRLVPNCPNDPSKVDTYTKARTSEYPWDAKKKTINVGKEATLTMDGNDYLVCGLFIHSGTLIMGNGGHVRIFVDTPEHCGLSAGATQVEVTGNASIKSTGYNPAEESYEVPTIYVLGSPTIPTNVYLSGTAANENEFILYAPYSDVTMEGNATWIGMIAGRSLSLHGNPTIKALESPDLPALTTQTLWERTHYVECTGASAAPPDASC